MDDFDADLNRVLRYGLEDEAAFHRKMLESPDEATTALVYADWLQEQGREALAHIVRRHVAGNRQIHIMSKSSGRYIPGGDELESGQSHFNTGWVTEGAGGGGNGVEVTTRSAADPDKFFLWHFVATPEEQSHLLQAADREGLAVHPVTRSMVPPPKEKE